MADFKINITTGFDGSGAKEATTSLQQLGAQTTSTASAGADLADKSKKVEQGLTEQAGSSEKAHVSHKALHKIMHLIGSQTAPELGHALNASFYGPIGGVLALGAAVEFLIGKAEVANEKIAEQAAIVHEAWEKALTDSSMRSHDLEDGLTRAGKPADELTAKFTAAHQVLEAQIKAHKEILAAMEREAMAAAGNNEAAKAAIRDRFDATNKEYDKATERLRIQKEATEVNRRQQRQSGLEDKATASSADVNAAENDPALIAARQALAGKDRKNLTNGILSEEQIEQLKHSLEESQKETGLEPAEKRAIIGGLMQTISQAEKARAALEAFDKNTETVTEHTETIRRLKKAQEEAATAAIENRNAITGGRDKLKTDRGVYNSGEAGEEITKAIGLTQRANAGGKLNPSEEVFVRNIVTMIAGQQVSLKQAEQMFTFASKNQSSLNVFIERLFRVLESMPNVSAHEARLAALEKKFQALSAAKSFGGGQ
ncbi:MAG: hypothetical protein JWR69_1175 [Pedosphaera sp.]|nr:hypothetical protein [Pedosphaera sp.]